MQITYLIALPGSLHAGTRTMIFTTGGGGYFGRQSSSASPARNVGGAANGVAITNITATNAVRASEVAVFMADCVNGRARDWLCHYLSAQSICLAQSAETACGNVSPTVTIDTIRTFQ